MRYGKAHDLLRAGGHLAFWSALHAFPEGFDPFFTEIQEVYDAIGESPDGDGRLAPPEQEPDSSERSSEWAVRGRPRAALRLGAPVHGGRVHRAARHVLRPHLDGAEKRERLYREIRVRLADRRVRRHWYAILHVARRKTKVESTHAEGPAHETAKGRKP